MGKRRRSPSSSSESTQSSSSTSSRGRRKTKRRRADKDKRRRADKEKSVKHKARNVSKEKHKEKNVEHEDKKVRDARCRAASSTNKGAPKHPLGPVETTGRLPGQMLVGTRSATTLGGAHAILHGRRRRRVRGPKSSGAMALGSRRTVRRVALLGPRILGGMAVGSVGSLVLVRRRYMGRLRRQVVTA